MSTGSSGPVAEVDPREAAELAGAGAVLLDVREAQEWEAGHAACARWIPMSRLAEEVEALATDRLIVCICHVGARSALVTRALTDAGWEAVNVRGGMAAWEAAGLPVVDEAGRPGRVV